MKASKKIVLLSLLLLLSATGLFASQGFEVSFNQPVSSEYDLEFELGDFRLNETQKNGEMFTEIDFAGSVVTNKKGFAALPYIHASVQISSDKNVTTQIVFSDYVEYELDHPLVPSRGIIYRNQDPSIIPYEIARESMVDEFYPVSISQTTEPYILRDIRGVNVYVYPFQYNAARNILRVYTNVTVKLTDDNSMPINPITSFSRTIMRDMHHMYSTIFINYDRTRFENELADFGSILVIHTPRDVAAILPYIEWKREKGHIVYVEEVVTGTNVISLVSSQYTAHNDILYVQLVGDWADIQGPTASGAAADPNLGCVVGGDIYMDLIVGRFSANSATHVTTQVNKTITYERDPDMGADWYKAAVGIASSQGAGIGDDGEADYEHMNVIWNDKLDPFTYDTYTPIYDPSANATMVANAVNAGTSIINYCGHGSMTSWVTSGFNNTHVNLLTNGEKLPFITSVACVNGAFDDGECFAEAWLKKDGGGAVGMFASSINQSWAPPMIGQDYIIDLLIGGYDYSLHPGQNGMTTDVQKTTYGSMCFNGTILMSMEDPGGGPSQMATWHVFGDASLQVRTDTPAEIVLSNSAVMMGIDFSTTITSAGSPVEGALVTLYQDDVSYSGVTDSNGDVTISHSLIAGDAKMIITGFNIETIYDDIAVIPLGGPYVIFESYVIDDTDTGNGNGSLENGEIVDLDMSVENLGSSQATNVIVTISSTDPYITIIDGTENFGNIAAGTIATFTGAFAIEAAGDIPDSHMIYFELEAVAEDTWISYFSIEAFAPMFPPENLTAEIQNYNDIVLTWDQPGGTDNTRDLTGYKVYKEGLEIAEITDPAILTYTDFALAAGDYEYYITALFHVGESDPSNIELVTLILPVPQNPQAVTQGLDILVTWDEPSNRAFSNYKVYRDLIMIADEVMETSYLDPAVPNGTYCYNIRAVYSGDHQSALSTDAVIEHVQTNTNEVIIPVTTELTGNFPNPFNPTTSIKYALHEDSRVQLEIFNIKGQKVKTLADGNQSAGFHTIVWDGKDNNSRTAASGLYFYKMVSEGNSGRYTSTKKMLLLK